MTFVSNRQLCFAALAEYIGYTPELCRSVNFDAVVQVNRVSRSSTQTLGTIRTRSHHKAARVKTRGQLNRRPPDLFWQVLHHRRRQHLRWSWRPRQHPQDYPGAPFVIARPIAACSQASSPSPQPVCFPSSSGLRIRAQVDHESRSFVRSWSSVFGLSGCSIIDTRLICPHSVS